MGILGQTGNTTLAANDAKQFSNFEVTYIGAERFAPYTKRLDATDAVVNLNNDSGTAWINATMKNSLGAYRGGTNVQRGERETFPSVNAEVGIEYQLGLRKSNNTGGASVVIKGSWAASNN